MKHTCYWIEPFRMFRRVISNKNWTIIIGLLIMIINFATLGLFKVLCSLYLTKRDGKEFKLKLCRSYFETIGKTMNEISSEMYSGLGFGIDD